jgi:hypothetical protein
MKVFNDLKPYNKFFVALLGAALTTVSQFYGNNPYVAMVLTLLTALGVYSTPNKVS